MKPRHLLPILTICLVAGLGYFSLATADHHEGDHGPSRAICVLRDVADSGVAGIIHFASHGDKFHITGTVKGLTPGKHGFHVHQYGDVSNDANGTSAGGHFDPHGHAHGSPDANERHVGDLGNITANADGVAKVDISDAVVRLAGENSIIGRSIVIHAKADDFGQPTGNAGPRVAYGVIGIAKAAE